MTDYEIPDESAWPAMVDYARTRRMTNAPIARALFEPVSPAVHFAGLAVWADVLASLDSPVPADWLRQ